MPFLFKASYKDKYLRCAWQDNLIKDNTLMAPHCNVLQIDGAGRVACGRLRVLQHSSLQLRGCSFSAAGTLTSVCQRRWQ